MAERRRQPFLPVPAPLQRLFDHFPLVTYPANGLPLRSPAPGSLPTLYVFISEHDACKGLPSFNPSCLKWQAFLRIAGVKFHVYPSTNHASPSGALPFLLPAASPTQHPPRTTAAAAGGGRGGGGGAAAVQPIPADKLLAYATAHATRPLHSPASKARQQAYQSLVDHTLRAAWLHALYLQPANTPLLSRLYLAPASTAAPVRLALHRQLHRAAEEEIRRAACSVSASVEGAAVAEEAVEADVYARTRTALAALATLLEESESGWFFGAAGPGVFDAAVFAYTHLLLDRAFGWVDRTLADMAAALPALVRHREALLAYCWPPLGDDEGQDVLLADQSWIGVGVGVRAEKPVDEALGVPLEESSYVEVDR